MAEQQAKFIDITRTYIPVDPNSFPESLHQAEREEAEARVPVMPYIGKNFLPTSYGYRSYFGINQDLGIDALPEMIDKIFVYQNASFSNMLIALCDSGIWIKSGEVAGAWTQSVAMDFVRDPANRVHHEWTYAIISDILYVYRQGQPSYQKITSIVPAPGILVTSVVPNFLNMEAQVGIYRAGGRLGFWDSADSTAWSNLDDFSDFTPSLETLAGNAVFSMVQGRITTIISHGNGFIIYASKSITYIEEAPDTLYQWKPYKILTGAGIAYPRQAVSGLPDSIHFAYTPIGLYKIEKAQADLIIPDVTDFLKESKGPQYLNFMEGRYLFVELLDPTYAEGLPLFSDEIIDAISVTLPGADLVLQDAVDDALTAGAPAYCPIVAGMGNGSYNQPEDGDPTKIYQPVYTASLSRRGFAAAVSSWTNAPVATLDPNGVEKNHCPVGGTLLSALSTNGAGNTVVAGADAYIDGNWTIERFVQAQTAIWETEQKNIDSFLKDASNRSSTGTKSTYAGSPPAIPGTTTNKALIGRFPSKFSAGQFGFSQCEFWLTRYAIQAVDLYRVKKNTFSLVDTLADVGVQGYDYWYYRPLDGNPGRASSMADLTSQAQVFPGPLPVYYDYGPDTSMSVIISSDSTQAKASIPGTFKYANNSDVYQGQACIMYRARPGYVLIYVTAGSWPTLPVIREQKIGGRYELTETMQAFNELVPVEAVPVPDTGYCTQTGWKELLNPAVIIPAGVCGASPVYPPGSTRGEANGLTAPVDDKGTYCSKPFEPFVIPGTPPVTVYWPDQEIVIPGGSFLLQTGSIAPYYPTVEGALVYDTQLKKWGKYVGQYKQLLDYSPINTFTRSPISYDRFGMMAGIVHTTGKLYLFDATPSDSYITWGKVGYYRLGVTSAEEIKVYMRKACTGFVRVDASVEGKNLSTGFSVTQEYTDTDTVTVLGPYPGKWHNITVGGIYDVTYIEYRGFRNGKR